MTLLFIVISILVVLLVVTLCAWQSQKSTVSLYKDYVLPRKKAEIEQLHKALAEAEDWTKHLVWHPSLKGITEDGREWPVAKPMILIKADDTCTIEGKIKLADTACREEDSGDARVLREIELPFACYMVPDDILKLHYEPKQHA